MKFQNDKGVSSLQRQFCMYVHLITEIQNSKWSKTDRTERRNRKVYYYSCRFQYFSQWLIEQVDRTSVKTEDLNQPTWPKGIQRKFYSTTEHRTFNKTNHLLDHKTNLNKFKRTEIIQSVFSDN